MPCTTSSGRERDAVVAIDALVNELAARVGRTIPLRNDARYPLNAPLTMVRLHPGTAVEELGRAWAFDLGAQGLGMITDCVVCTGDEMHVKLRGLDGRDHLVPLRITHTDRLFGNVYRIGGQFLLARPAAAAA